MIRYYFDWWRSQTEVLIIKSRNKRQINDTDQTGILNTDSQAHVWVFHLSNIPQFFAVHTVYNGTQAHLARSYVIVIPQFTASQMVRGMHVHVL